MVDEGIRIFSPADSQDEVTTLELEPVSETAVRVLYAHTGMTSPGKHERIIVSLDFLGDIRKVKRKLVDFKRYY